MPRESPSFSRTARTFSKAARGFFQSLVSNAAL